MGQRISDKRIPRLVGILLRCGVMINGVVSPSQEGAVQGGPLSPLLSNAPAPIFLDTNLGLNRV